MGVRGWNGIHCDKQVNGPMRLSFVSVPKARVRRSCQNYWSNIPDSTAHPRLPGAGFSEGTPFNCLFDTDKFEKPLIISHAYAKNLDKRLKKQPFF